MTHLFIYLFICSLNVTPDQHMKQKP